MRRRYVSLAFWARDRKEASRMTDPDWAQALDESPTKADDAIRDHRPGDVLAPTEVHLDAA